MEIIMTSQAQTMQADHSNSLTEQEVTAAVDAARQKAAQAGKRFTPLREHVYKLLLTASQPSGAYEILERLDGVGANKPPTAYRCLEWLMEQGLARRIASVSKFVAAPLDPDLTSVAYLLCHECGQAEAVDVGDFGDTLQKLAQAQGFKNDETVIELTGLCRGHAR